MTTLEQLDAFNRFAKELVEKEGPELSLSVIFDRWHHEANLNEDALAILASVRDYENGERGRPVEEFLAELRDERAAGQEQ